LEHVINCTSDYNIQVKSGFIKPPSTKWHYASMMHVLELTVISLQIKVEMYNLFHSKGRMVTKI